LEIQRLEKVESTLQEQEERIEKYRQESTSYKAQIASLIAEIETLQKYKDRLNESQDAVSDLMSRIAGMATKITTLKKELKTLEEETERRVKKQQDEIIRLQEYTGVLQAEFEMMEKEKDTQIQTIQTELNLKDADMEILGTRTREAETQLIAVQESINRTLNIDQRLEDLSAASAQRTLSLEKKLEVFELTADGLTKMKEDLIQEKQMLQEKVQMVTTYEKVLQNTELGKIFLLVKALGTTNIEHLSRALGTPKIIMLPSVRELTRMGVIMFDNTNVTFVKSDMESPPT